MASNKSKTPGPIQVVVVLMLTVLAFYFGNRFGQVFDFNTMEITDGALATVNSIVAAPAAISTASVPMLYAIGLAITVLIVWLYTFMYAGNYRYGEEAGSAKWGTLKEGVAFKDQSDPSNNLLFTKNYGLALKKPKFDLEHDRNLNVMVIGGSGSGKTRNYVKPNLMQLNASYFLTDPKGTSLPECGYLFRDNGYRIKVFNTIEFNKSMHYNPLKYVKTDADILSFVNCLISNTNGDKQSGGDPFWENSERLLYTALIALLRDWFPPEDYSLDGLLTLLSMAEAKENDENFKSPLDMIFDEIETGKVYERNPFYQGPSTSSSYADAESDRMAISENTTDEFTWQSSLMERNNDGLSPAREGGLTSDQDFALANYKMFKVAAGVVCSKRLLNQAVGKSLRTHNLKPKKGAQVMRKNEKITALYERLSRDDFGKDDDQQRESNSISNQKAMLEEFAARQGFTNIVHFTDDGISGTCFDRPGFLAMMKEVEAGNVEYLCIKDMSRMGRDYLKVGQIMEILRQRGVRLIAINDGVDSARGDDDFTPFRNIMNEYYARDTSRKIRSTFQSKGKSGKHLTGTVIYGYLWNEARDQWLVDPEAADVVKRIFAMTIDGYGPYQIASKLKSEKVLIPSAYLAQHGEGVNKNKTFKDVYGWGSSTICNILEKREYLGHTINFKTRKHFKDKKSHYVPEDEWTIFENTHEPIIDQQTFDLVQKIRGNVRRYPDGWGEAAPLTGLLYCADCGGKMYVHRTNNGKRISQYTCSQYSKVPVGKLCKTQHRINEDVVLSLVSEMLKAIAEYAKHDRAEFVRVVQEAQSSQQTAEVKKQRIRLATAKQRVSELEVLLCKIYEDNILGKLSDSRYATLDAQYEKEQTELTAEISALEKAVKSYEKHEKDADRFIALIDKYENFDKLTIAMLNEFIEKILVHERDRKGSIQTTQEVEIYFNFVGRFVPPAFGEVELTPEELEEIRKREERKDRLHQNYLKRKASGAQKRYEDKIKGRKKAEIEAKKAAIRAEDIAKGVFVPVSSLPQREPMKGVQTA